MTTYAVTANRLNLREQPNTGAVVLAVLPWGHLLDGAADADPKWLKVVAKHPQGAADVSGFVFAEFAAEPADDVMPAGPTPFLPSLENLRIFAPRGKLSILEAVAAEFATTGAAFGLTKSRNLLCHFLAQACHESDRFKTTREYWGPTPAQRGYEGRLDLGNVHAGDGKRYMGRGIFQLTGRANYRTFGHKLNLNLEGNPELAAEPRTSFKIACHYWKARGIEPFAEADNIREVTRRINGGERGLDDRRQLLADAKRIFP